MSLYSLNSVLRYLSSLQYSILVIKNSSLGFTAPLYTQSTTCYTVRRFWQNPFIGLFVEVECLKVYTHCSIIYLIVVIDETKDIIMQHVTVFFKSLWCLHSFVKNLHKCAGIAVISFICIKTLQISYNFSNVVLNTVSPCVTRSKLFHLLRSQRIQVKHFRFAVLLSFMDGL